MSAEGGKGNATRPTKLESLANVTTIVVSLLLSIVLVKVFLLPGGRPAASAARPQVAEGTSLKGALPGVDWGTNDRTLVLAISTKCHFCTDSAPFFKRISTERPTGTKLLAVLPQSVEEARKYLDQEGVRVDDVKQAPLDSIKVYGPPTLALVDKAGTVTDVWTGKLSADGEAEVLHVLENTQRPKK
jgi:hypothetical protein